MMSRLNQTIILFGFLFGSLAAQAVQIKASATQGDVQFEAVGKPSMLKIKGKGEGAVTALKLDQNKLNGEIEFKLETLNSGIGLRDEHMKEKYLHVPAFPKAVLSFKDFTLPATWSLAKPTLTETPFTATLKLHGVEKPVQGTFVIENEKLKSQAHFEIKLSDFGIDIPNYLGVKVADVVKIEVNFYSMDVVK